jgi:hypothetical protein
MGRDRLLISVLLILYLLRKILFPQWSETEWEVKWYAIIIGIVIGMILMNHYNHARERK